MAQFEALDGTLRCSRKRGSEPSKQPEPRGRKAVKSTSPKRTKRVDRELLAMHRRLMDETYFHVPARPSSS